MAKEKFIGVEEKISLPLRRFAVMNSNNQFFKSWGYGRGAQWEDDINNAKIYRNAGGARNLITRYMKDYKKHPVPSLVMFQTDVVLVINDEDRAKKALIKRELAKERQELNNAQWALKHAQETKARAEQEIIKAKKKLEQKKAELNK